MREIYNRLWKGVNYEEVYTLSYIYLGNQTISDLEIRTGYNFSEEDRKWLELHRQNEADIKFNEVY